MPGYRQLGNLTWGKVDLTRRVIKLEAEDTKTCEPRVVFFCHRAYDILKVAGKVRFLEHDRVFTYRGAPLGELLAMEPDIEDPLAEKCSHSAREMGSR